MWSSIVYQPLPLLKTMIGARVWEKVKPLAESEKVDLGESIQALQQENLIQLDIPGGAEG
jgi:hypothetical protein